MKRVAKYMVVGGILPFAMGVVLAPSSAQENVKEISLRLERSFAAPREKVFRLWTDPQAVAKWFLPPEMHTGRSRPPLKPAPEAVSACGSSQETNLTICTEHFLKSGHRRNLF